MHVPPTLAALVEDGILDAVLYPLKSGKEADLFVVEKDGRPLAAKVYKARDKRNFRNQATYREGRRVRSTREQRAMGKNSRFGKELLESGWHRAEVDALRTLWAAGVRVPEVLAHHEDVVVMDLVTDASGRPAPQLAQVPLDPEQAARMCDLLIGEVVKMLCADLIHGDLSPYNVLVGTKGPVIIDLPQVISAVHHADAARLLERDVKAVTRHLGLTAPTLRKLGEESWQIWLEYEQGKLTPDFRPTLGLGRPGAPVADLDRLLAEVNDARAEARAEAERREGPPEPPKKKLFVFRRPEADKKRKGARPGGKPGQQQQGRRDERAAPSGGQASDRPARNDGRASDRPARNGAAAGDRPARSRPDAAQDRGARGRSGRSLRPAAETPSAEERPAGRSGRASRGEAPARERRRSGRVPRAEGGDGSQRGEGGRKPSSRTPAQGPNGQRSQGRRDERRPPLAPGAPAAAAAAAGAPGGGAPGGGRRRRRRGRRRGTAGGSGGAPGGTAAS